MSKPSGASDDAAASAGKHNVLFSDLGGDSDSERGTESKAGGGGWAAALAKIELEDETAGSRPLATVPEPPKPPARPYGTQGGGDATAAQMMHNPMALQMMMMMMQQMMMMQSMGMPTQETQLPNGQAMMPPMPPAMNPVPPPPAAESSGPVSEAGMKKVKEYQRLMKKGDNLETCFVGGLRKSTDEDQVFSHFSKFGEVEKVEIKRQPDGTSRGFAFVRFKETGAVARVIEKRAAHMIDNKWIDVKRHNGVAACAGRATSLSKDTDKDQDEAKEKEPEEAEEDFTTKYLTMAQQLATQEQQEQSAGTSVPDGQGMVAMMPMAPVMGPGMVMVPPMMGQSPGMMGAPMGCMSAMSGMNGMGAMGGMMAPGSGMGPGYGPGHCGPCGPGPSGPGACGPGPCIPGPYGPYGGPCGGGPYGNVPCGGGPCAGGPCGGGYGAYGPAGPYGYPRPGPYGKGMW